MSDRLPAPLEDSSVPMGAERASATPAQTPSRRAPPPAKKEDVLFEAPRTLRDVQAWMVRAITGKEEDASGAEAVVTPGHSLSARERFEIYRYGYRARLVECLADDYPVLLLTLGEPAFEALCHGYIEQYPSSSPNLNAFGRHMAHFVLEADLDESVALRREFLAELATLEWALVEVVHRETPLALDLSQLQGLPASAWETARFEPSLAVRLFRFAYPVNAYFQRCRVKGEASPIPDRQASETVVYRHSLTVWRMDLTPAMARVLEALLAGVPIAEALGKLGLDESDPAAVAEAERSVMVWFREWVSSGLFASLRT